MVCSISFQLMSDGARRWWVGGDGGCGGDSVQR